MAGRLLILEQSHAHAYWSGYTYKQLYPLVSYLLQCLRNPIKHHLAVYEKHRDGRRCRGASKWVKDALRCGFTLYPMNPPPPLKRAAIGSLFW
jgi:hypothetical protein